MYILYEKATGRIVRAMMSTAKEPDWNDAIVGLENERYLYAGFTTADDEHACICKHEYEVVFDGQSNPRLLRHQQVSITCQGGWILVKGWQQAILENEDTPIFLKFQDEHGDPIEVSGEIRIDSHRLYVSDAYATLDKDTEFSFLIRGYHPCHAAIDVHLYPENHPFQRLDEEANAGRPLVRTRHKVNVLSLGTFRKYANKHYYELTTDKVSIPADGSSVANLTVVRRHPNGTADTSSNETVRIITTRGRLSEQSLQLSSGVGHFTLRSTEETVTADVIVKSESGQTLRDEVSIDFHA